MSVGHSTRAIVISREIHLLAFKEKLLELIEAVMKGEEVAIAKDNQPVVKLVAIPPAKKKRWPSKAGSAKGMVWMSDDFDEPLEEFKEYME